MKEILINQRTLAERTDANAKSTVKGNNTLDIKRVNQKKDPSES